MEILELRTTITEVRNLLRSLILYLSKLTISELEGRSIEIRQSGQHREKNGKKITSEICGTSLNIPAYAKREHQKKRSRKKVFQHGWKCLI